MSTLNEAINNLGLTAAIYRGIVERKGTEDYLVEYIQVMATEAERLKSELETFVEMRGGW